MNAADVEGVLQWRQLVVHSAAPVSAGTPAPVFGGRARSRNAPPGDSCPWGNYAYTSVVRSPSDRIAAVTAYRASLEVSPELVLRARRELKGKRLACYCAPRDCHLHVLAQAANCSLTQLAAWFPRAAALHHKYADASHESKSQIPAVPTAQRSVADVLSAKLPSAAVLTVTVPTPTGATVMAIEPVVAAVPKLVAAPASATAPTNCRIRVRHLRFDD